MNHDVYNMEEMQTLSAMIAQSREIVFLGGAGVSTESGVPDFRSQDGLYGQRYAYPPETILSHDFFMSNTSEFYAFYRDKMIYAQAQPNRAHLALAQLEAQGKLTAVITQNIDGLHTRAGSVNVLELHGSVLRNTCMRCEKGYGLERITRSDEPVPVCDCGGIIKPDVVLYGEGLEPDTLARASAHIRRADMLIVGGTSLNVYPAAGLVTDYRGDRLVLINLEKTPYDGRANLVVRGKIGAVLGQVVQGA